MAVKNIRRFTCDHCGKSVEIEMHDCGGGGKYTALLPAIFHVVPDNKLLCNECNAIYKNFMYRFFEEGLDAVE